LGRSWTRKSNGREAFAAFAAAIAQNGAATFAGIAIEKSVLAFAPDFRRLILAFHKFNKGALGRGKSVNRAGNPISESPAVKAALGDKAGLERLKRQDSSTANPARGTVTIRSQF